MSVLLLQGNALKIPLADKKVNMVCTSPPFYGLRDYGTAEWIGGDENCEHTISEWNDNLKPNVNRPERDGEKRKACLHCGAKRLDAQLGLEPTLQEYIDNTVLWCREVWRVLRDDGTFWLNLGDSYAGSWGSYGNRPEEDGKPGTQREKNVEYYRRGGYRSHRDRPPTSFKQGNLKPKDLMLVPHRVAIALQNDGWWVRSDIVWHKPNPMPESVNGWRWEQHRIKVKGRGKSNAGIDKQEKIGQGNPHAARDGYEAKYIDCPGCDKCNPNNGLVLKKGSGRPTKSHEYIFLLTKSKSYYYDRDAIRERANYDGRHDTMMKGSEKYNAPVVPGQEAHTFALRGHERWPNKLEDGTPARNKRSVWTMTTKPYKGAHFATFPPELPETCIKAGTSEKGVCPVCGSQWARITEKETTFEGGSGKAGRKPDEIGGKWGDDRYGENILLGPVNKITTLGWKPTCSHNEEPIPAIVCDPFVGSGTVPMVAHLLGRNGIGIDLSWEYLQLARERTGEKAWKEWIEGRRVSDLGETLEELPLFKVQNK